MVRSSTETLVLPPVRTAVLRLVYRAEQEVRFVDEPVSVWRGQLGRFLHHVSPPGTPSGTASLYDLFFSTPREAVAALSSVALTERRRGRLGLGGSHVPHPFVLRGWSCAGVGGACVLRAGDCYVLEVVLIEQAVVYLPALCAALGTLGGWGIGARVRQASGREERGTLGLEVAVLEVGRLSLKLYDGRAWRLPAVVGTHLFEQVEAFTGTAVGRNVGGSAGAASFALEARTPLCINHRGQYVRRDAFGPDVLLRALYRRHVGLAVCYGGYRPDESELEAHDRKLDAMSAATVIRADRLRWRNGTRYSARQRSAIPLMGLVGDFEVATDEAYRSTWEGLLDLAGRVHVGKGSSIGYGWLARGPAAATT